MARALALAHFTFDRVRPRRDRVTDTLGNTQRHRNRGSRTHTHDVGGCAAGDSRRQDGFAAAQIERIKDAHDTISSSQGASMLLVTAPAVTSSSPAGVSSV